jgi:imidazole glycerol phosphate synthase subunit HisF
MYAVKKAGGAEVAAASMFHFTESTAAAAKAAVQASAITVNRNYTENAGV